MADGSGRQAKGFQGAVHFVAQVEVMLIPGRAGLGWMSQPMLHSRQQWFDHLLAHEQARAHRAYAAELAEIAARFIPALDQLLAPQLWRFRSSKGRRSATRTAVEELISDISGR